MSEEETRFAGMHPAVVHSLEEVRSEMLYLRTLRYRLTDYIAWAEGASKSWGAFDNRHAMLQGLREVADLPRSYPPEEADDE